MALQTDRGYLRRVSPVTHLFASWLVAAKMTDNPRDCRLVTLAGILPDADGLGLVVDWLNGSLGRGEAFVYQQYHHFLLHGMFAGVVCVMLAAALARHRWRTALLALAVFHLHLLADLVGSRGPSPGDLWPVYYLGPLSHRPMWVWSGQWALDGWPNRLISVALFAGCLGLAVQQGHSLVGVFNRRVDSVVVGVLRKWWASLAHALAASRARRDS